MLLIVFYTIRIPIVKPCHVFRIGIVGVGRQRPGSRLDVNSIAGYKNGAPGILNSRCPARVGSTENSWELVFELILGQFKLILDKAISHTKWDDIRIQNC